MAKHNFNSSVGGNIRRLRENNNWSQHVIADRLNISIPAYSKIETGVTDVNLSRLEQIAHVFDIDLAGLFTHEGVHERISSKEHERLEKELQESEKEIIQLQRKVIQLYDEIHKSG